MAELPDNEKLYKLILKTNSNIKDYLNLAPSIQTSPFHKSDQVNKDTSKIIFPRPLLKLEL